jgi:hypothetical protein
MCSPKMKTPDPPTIPERQAAQEPKINIRERLRDRDRRRRGYAAAMLAAPAPMATSNVTGV